MKSLKTNQLLAAALLGVMGAAPAFAYVTSDVQAAFDPENQVIPFPNNLLFEAAVTEPGDLDGTLNAPVEDPDDDSAAVVQALNTLDGFSPVGAWRMEFNGDIDPDSLVGGETVRVFDMGDAGEGYPERVRPEVVERELTPGEDYHLEYDPDQRALQIIPARALGYNRHYTAVITEGVEDAEGDRVGFTIEWAVARLTDHLDQCDEPVKEDFALLQCTANQAIAPIEESPEFELDRSDMILAWGVTTQRMDATFVSAAEFIRNNGLFSLFEEETATCESVICIVNLDEVTGEEAPRTPDGNARILPGSIRLPYGLEEASDRRITGDGDDHFPPPAQDDVVLGTHWQCDEGGCNTDAVRGETDVAELIRSVQTAPFVMAVPDASQSNVPAPPSGGYPVVVFQHAIQQNRSNALAVADRLAEKGFAVAAIDMPLHGLVLEDIEMEELTDLYAPAFNAQLYDSAIVYNCLLFCDEIVIADGMRDSLPLIWERTQYLDLVDGEGNPGSDGQIDSSGEHFLNPAQPLTQRDNLRQGALDLVTLTHHLRSGDISECGTKIFGGGLVGPDCSLNAALGEVNAQALHFAGHSVGNIVAAPFISYDGDINTVSMLTPAGGMLRALEGSETIGPQLLEGLAESGVEPGTEDFYRFMVSVQAVIDSVEPLNHAPAFGLDSSGDPRPVYMSQILGNDGSDGVGVNPPDLVLPVAVEGRPLAGSTPLATAAGLELAVREEDHPGNGAIILDEGYSRNGALQAMVGFRFGSHASPLQPLTEDEDPREGEGPTFVIPRGIEVHNEMQSQLADFLANGGVSVTIGDVTLVESR